MRASVQSRIVVPVGVLLALAYAGIADAKTKTQTFSSGDVAVTIGDPFGLPFANAVSTGVQPRNARIKDVDVAVRLDHPNNGDVRIFVGAPLPKRDARAQARGIVGADFADEIELSSDNGAGGANYGAGPQSCAGTPTIFDDAAPTPITAGTPPFVGEFKPEEPLQELNGSKTKRGRWEIFVGDSDLPGTAPDIGTLYCFQVTVKYKPLKKK